ncbi:microtubule-associated protein Jupiter-like isoform X3 [Ceratina calcarata]|uniref:Microtubule-associated protein Jupiter n=1 Tax=Ceratina calcarata TaxID=156304 RepID=A0AAJ7WFR0_9HYME|nr:microtubule-associated protein Jupiter-like isoform X3 [Ceratina calcarata]
MCTSHVSILSPPRGDTFHADKKREITLDARLICFRVLKPPGGGSSDIFGAAPDETSPRRVKNHQQSQLGSTLFGETANSNSSNETPRNKPGNDSYNRLFGPPDAPPTTPNAKYHMRSNISLSGDSTSSSVSSGAATSPAKSIGSTDSITAVLNGYAATNGNNHTNDVTGGSSCLTRNPVTGDGVDVTPVRRSARRCRGNVYPFLFSVLPRKTK